MFNIASLSYVKLSDPRAVDGDVAALNGGER